MRSDIDFCFPYIYICITASYSQVKVITVNMVVLTSPFSLICKCGHCCRARSHSSQGCPISLGAFDLAEVQAASAH